MRHRPYQGQIKTLTASLSKRQRPTHLKFAEMPPEPDSSHLLDPHTARIVRLYLERVAMRLERTEAGSSYKMGLGFAAKVIRASKPD